MRDGYTKRHEPTVAEIMAMPDFEVDEKVTQINQPELGVGTVTGITFDGIEGEHSHDPACSWFVHADWIINGHMKNIGFRTSRLRREVNGVN